MSDELVQQIESYGATRDQLVDLTQEEPRTLRYLDLVRARDEDRPVLALESQRQPRAYVFDARQSAFNLGAWVRRIAFRGDADYIAVLRPGRLDVYPVVLGGNSPPASLKDLPEGPLRFPTLLQKPQAGEAIGIRTQLRNLLRQSIENARRLGHAASVNAHDAISLVGRALFWRFLIDRQLLQGLNPSEICGDSKAQAFADCLVTRARSLKTFDWLDQTFNGSFLQFRTKERASELPEIIYNQVVGNISHAATAEGQLELPSEWRHVNFAHVPVGLLSEVYEAYAHQEDTDAAEGESIFYTPRHIAEFMVEESFASLDHVEAPRVLDPAAGAGVFLVAVFRALVAREWARTKRQPSRRVIRRILYNQLAGFDINDEALRLAELALYLTAIELDPQPNPQPLSLLKFEKPLRGMALHLRGGGHSRGSLGPVDPEHKEQFDLVIGNPPWTADASIEDKQRWANDSRELVKSRLGDARSKTFTFPDAFPDIPFVYRAMEWARPRAQIALVTHARWLFPGKADEARRDLLQSVQVTGLLNGTALRETSVWPNSRAPFAILFACNARPEHGSAFQFVSPLVSDKDQKAQRLLRIDWNDAKVVSVDNAVTKPWLLKTRFRGTGFDEQIVNRLMAAHPSLVDYVEKTLGTTIRNGYRVGNRKNSTKWLRDMPCITPRLKKSPENQLEPPIGFWVDPSSLLPCGEAQVEASRPRNAYTAPLLLVRQSPPANPSEPRAVVAGAESKSEVAFSQSWHGASFAQVDDGLDEARWLQLLLQSKVFLYFALLTDGAFGVERDRYVLETLKAFPVIPLKRLAKPQRRVALELSKTLWTSGWSEALEKRIDKLVFDTYDLDDIDRDNVCDTLDTALPYAKNRRRALTPPKPHEIKRFTEVLQEELSHVLATSNERACVRLRTEVNTGPWSVLQVDRLTHKTRTPGDIAIPWAKVLQEADASGATLVTVSIDAVTTLAAILHHYRYWTPTRARMLALSILEGKSS